MKTFFIVLTALMTSLSLVHADARSDARSNYAAKTVNALNKLAVFVKGAC